MKCSCTSIPNSLKVRYIYHVNLYYHQHYLKLILHNQNGSCTRVIVTTYEMQIIICIIHQKVIRLQNTNKNLLRFAQNESFGGAIS